MNNDEEVAKKFLEDYIKNNMGSNTRKYLTMGSVAPERAEMPDSEISSELS
jgi:hypothetical protein